MDEFVEEQSFLEEMVLVDDSNSMPLEVDRTAELAMDCWNLKRTIYDQNSESLKTKQALSRFKNLIKNLQIIIATKENEISTKNKELFSLKEKQLESDKKNQVLSTANNQSVLNLSKCRKQIVTLESKVLQLQTDVTALNSKYTVARRELTEEFSMKDAASLREINELSEERDELLRENRLANNKMQEEMLQFQKLSSRSVDLQDRLTAREREVETSASFFSSELEEAYESLHNKLEISLGNTLELQEHIAQLEQENHRLQSFILTEGLQLPR